MSSERPKTPIDGRLRAAIAAGSLLMALGWVWYLAGDGWNDVPMVVDGLFLAGCVLTFAAALAVFRGQGDSNESA